MRIVLISTAVVAMSTSLLWSSDWSRFRGPNGSGVVNDSDIPSEWSAEKNLRWRTELPGRGVSSPIVSGDLVFVTAYTGYGLDPLKAGKPGDLVRHLLAFDRKTGEERWRASVPATVEEDPYQGFLVQHGYASSTPVADDKHVFVLFGKSGLFAFDRQGKQVWQTSLGTKSDPLKWGDATSPILYGNLVIVNAGVLGNHLVAVDKQSGEVAWTLKDDKFTNCWSTPVIASDPAGDQILFHVPGRMMSADPKTGQLLWTVDSPIDDATCASVILDGPRAIVLGSRAGHGMAVEWKRNGDQWTASALWKKSMRSGIGTPVLHDRALYWSTGGIFYAVNSRTGNEIYKKRLPRKSGPTGGFATATYSSPVCADKRLVLFTRNGESYVIAAGKAFELLGHNGVFAGDKSEFSATPAIADGAIFMRSDRYLYCLGDAARSE